MNNLQIFNNSEFGEIRILTINDEPWFVGKDVAKALGYSDSFGALKKHVDLEDKQNCQNSSFESNRGLTIINESGLYSLILSSKLPTAKKFKRWVTSEVLPSIRKTGHYSVISQRELTKDDYLAAARMVATCRNERLPYVLNLLEKAGFSIPDIKQEEIKSENDIDVNLLSRLICESGMTLNELCKLTNVCKSSLSYYARKISKPSKERYVMLIQMLSN